MRPSYPQLSSEKKKKNQGKFSFSHYAFIVHVNLFILHWRVGAIHQMRRLAKLDRGNHGNQATGQPQHLSVASHSFHSGKTRRGGWGKSTKCSKPWAKVKHECKQQQWQVCNSHIKRSTVSPYLNNTSSYKCHNNCNQVNC